MFFCYKPVGYRGYLQHQDNLYNVQQPSQKIYGHLHNHTFCNRNQSQDHMQVHQQQNNYNQQFYPASSCHGSYIQSGSYKKLQRINQNYFDAAKCPNTQFRLF